MIIQMIIQFSYDLKNTDSEYYKKIDGFFDDKYFEVEILVDEPYSIPIEWNKNLNTSYLGELNVDLKELNIAYDDEVYDKIKESICCKFLDFLENNLVLTPEDHIDSIYISKVAELENYEWQNYLSE